MRILLIAVIMLINPVISNAQDVLRRMTITGTGEVFVAPDLATVNLGVSSFNKQASQAMALNSQAMTAIFKALKGADIESRDIQTASLSLNPQWDRRSNSNNQPKIIGYNAVNTVTVRVRDLTKVGPVLDLLTKLGANRINGISFGIQKPRPHQDEARKRAVKDARTKAALYVGAAGVALGQIISINENGGGQRPQPMARMEMAAMVSDSVPIAEGELRIRSNVTIVFELK